MVGGIGSLVACLEEQREKEAYEELLSEGKLLNDPEIEEESALQTQVGGSHYKEMKIQPVEFITANNLGFIQGSVIKYISRYKSKNGRQDLEKAKHFIELLIQLEYGD
jgi:hypothetical protein